MSDAKKMYGLHACGCVSYAVVYDPADPSPGMMADFWKAVSKRQLNVVTTPLNAPSPPWDCPDPRTCRAPATVQARRRKRDKTAGTLLPVTPDAAG